ncbi:J domain-containing protein [Clostridium massiliodielmoense]|uniref:J domain-containing protein n=1 Tax=Clostridium massiliodielmoense TaxID=1776385 RepID=UPI0004D4F197|nr:tetratricopeptide repeat protein [Clostridium massiliodielmoense]KEH98867.1 hypothetical protein Z962_10085 [Clostridium botulinum C/D str. BKT12695]
MVKNMDNLYGILQIDDKARSIEIKKAYIKMLRQYPPEKSPEQFKKIREAYEILVDPILKAEYNAFMNYKDKIEEYRKKGNYALEKKQYRRSILYYKKILLIEPKITFAKNKLGLAFFYNNQYEEAIIQFRELIQLNPKNSIFYNNLAYVYKEQKKYDVAEELLLKSYELDETNEKTVLVLGDIYIVTEKYHKGIEFLNKCINKSDSDCFRQIMYYLKVLNIYIHINNIASIEKTLKCIKNIVPDEERIKEYIVWKLYKIAEKLLEKNNYALGNKICEVSITIDEQNQKFVKLYNKFQKLLKVSNYIKLLIDDKRVMEALKKPILYYLHWDEYNEKDFIIKKEKNIQEIRESIESNFLDVITSVDILKKEYIILYNYKRELYEQAYNMAEENKQNSEIPTEVRDIFSESIDIDEDWPTLYNDSINIKRKYSLKKRYFKILLICIIIFAVLGTIVYKFHLFKKI